MKQDDKFPQETEFEVTSAGVKSLSTVLIIDAQELFRDSLAALFERNGFTARVANTADGAFDQLKLSKIDLIVLDVDLPVAQGLVFLQQLREVTAGHELPVIVLTSVVDKNCILRAKNLGVREYLLKQLLRSDRLLERARSLTSISSPDSPPPIKPRIAKFDPASPKKGGGPPSMQRPSSASPTASATVSRTDTSQWPKLLTREQTLDLVDHITDEKTIAGRIL